MKDLKKKKLELPNSFTNYFVKLARKISFGFVANVP